MCCSARVGKAAEPPKWIKPQLTRNGDEPPAGNDWLHEIKYDGYRMHARLEGGKALASDPPPDEQAKIDEAVAELSMSEDRLDWIRMRGSGKLVRECRKGDQIIV